MHPPRFNPVSSPQVAATRSPAANRPVTLGKTEFIAQDNGHLLPTLKSRDSAFRASFATGALTLTLTLTLALTLTLTLTL